jgi:hypothetical protein
MVIRQQADADCGVSALGMLLADLAMRRVDPEWRGMRGLFSVEVVKAAKGMGVTLTSLRRPTEKSLDRDSGILVVRWNSGERKANAPYGHYVTLIQGCIYCPSDSAVMPWRLYLARYDGYAATLLKVKA